MKHHRQAEQRFRDNSYDRLAAFNSERARGIVHTPEYEAEMAQLQELFDAELRAEAKRRGYTIVGNRA